MKKLLTFIFIFLVAATGYTDMLIIPFSGYPKEIQARFKEYGLKVDLDGNDRDKESWGFIDNRGSEIILYTYTSVTDEDRMLVMDILKGE